VRVAALGKPLHRSIQDLLLTVRPRDPLGSDAATGLCHTRSLAWVGRVAAVLRFIAPLTDVTLAGWPDPPRAALGRVGV